MERKISGEGFEKQAITELSRRVLPIFAKGENVG
jgi:hypothetical protein